MPRRLKKQQFDIEDGLRLKQTKIEEYFHQSKMAQNRENHKLKKVLLPYPFSDDEYLEVAPSGNTDSSKKKDAEVTSNGKNKSSCSSSDGADTTLEYRMTGETSVTILENIVISPTRTANREKNNKSTQSSDTDLSKKKDAKVTSNRKNKSSCSSSDSVIPPSNGAKRKNNNNSKKKTKNEDDDANKCPTPTKKRNTTSTPPSPDAQCSSSRPHSTPLYIENLYMMCGHNHQVNGKMGTNYENLPSTPLKMHPIFSRSNTSSTNSSVKGASPTKTPLRGNGLSHSTPKSEKKLPFSPGTPGKSGETSANSSMKDESMTKPEDEKFNLKQLDCMKELYKDTLSNSDKRRLLKDGESQIIEDFLEMDINSQYLLIKLFLYLPKWYHHLDFCKKIKLDQKISVKEIHRIYDALKEKKFINTDLGELGIDALLNMTSGPNLKDLCKKYKLNTKSTKRDDLIQALKTNCRTQRNLFSRKTPENVLKDRTLEYLGIRFQLEDNIRMALRKAYLVQVFTMSSYIDPQVYFNDKIYKNVAYVDFKTENYSPFLNCKQFSRYTEAILLKKDYYDYAEKKKYENMEIVANEAFTKLKRIPTDGKCPNYFPNHLRKFSAEYQYISILTAASKKLIKFHGSVKIWLEYLVEHHTSHWALGYWYKQLTHIFVHYLKNHEEAARIAIKAFEFDKENKSFNLIQIHELSNLATRISGHKRSKLPNLLRDKLSASAESPIKSDDFIKTEISGRTDRNSKTGKRVYSYIDENGDHVYGTVEMFVINHYKTKENYEGKHFEGQLLQTLFVLLFWDIIYDVHVQYTFISKLQNAPLDMFSRNFYQNRKESIDKRLQEISQDWSQEKIESVLKENWTNHSHEYSFIDIDTISSSVEELLKMFQCIKRNLLAKIFERMVTNFKLFRSGLPDLFLWKPETLECKFVEVKGEGDKLSLKQMLWIKYMMEHDACVEVCHVTGVGAKRIFPDAEAEDSD